MSNYGSKRVKTNKPNKKNDITNIIFKNINEEYSLGKFGDFNVIIMKENGYINATKLCNDAKTKNGTKKDFREWKKNSSTKELTKEISRSGGSTSIRFSLYFFYILCF